MGYGIIRGAHSAPGIYTKMTINKQVKTRIGLVNNKRIYMSNINTGGNGSNNTDKKSYLTFTALEDNCMLGFYHNPDSPITPTIEYSFDNINWNVLTEDKVTVQKDTNIYCRGINPNGISIEVPIEIDIWDNDILNNLIEGWAYNYFIGDGKFNVSGDIMSLINYNTMPDVMVGSMCFLFGQVDLLGKDFNTIDIIDASGLILSAKVLTRLCYGGMFIGCENLTTAPELPATTLTDYCYMGMFAFCTGLTNAPELPATTLAEGCYGAMFGACTSLTTAPELPATTLTDYCYMGMFAACTSLTTAPELPATTLAEGCYGAMFGACTSLTTAPELPATTLTDYCYMGMFVFCTGLNTITCLATDISAEGCTSSWVEDVSSSGTFYKHPDMNNWTRGYSGIPSSWVVENYIE